MDGAMGWFGKSSLVIFIALFGGSTLLLFLICFCCQRKLQARTLAMADIVDVESRRTTHQQNTNRQQRRSDMHQLLPTVISPPPDYATVVKKDEHPCDPVPPPSYEVAISGLGSNGHM